MADSSMLLVDNILPNQPIRQWVLSVPFPLRWLFASQPQVMSKVLEVVIRGISSYLINKAGFTHKTAKTGAVTLIQRFGSALNLNIHFHRNIIRWYGNEESSDSNSGSATATIPELEITIGGLYEKSLPYGDFKLQAGWMWASYFNAIEVADSFHNGRTKESNFTVQGPYVGLQWMGNF